MFKLKQRFVLAALVVSFFLLPSLANADVLEQREVFLTNETYDKFSRVNMVATLKHVSQHAYFYIDDAYWNNLGDVRRGTLSSQIVNLATEFDNNIYKKETQFWGSPASPGIDGDTRITILLEETIKGNGGYFETINNYPKSVAPDSNEREMIAVSIEAVEFNLDFAKNFLAHEFQHLISFNQKDLTRGVSEEIWLNELRSEYSTTVVGYNDTYKNSNLENRVETFIDNSTDSLTEWPNKAPDYAAVALFAEYLVEQYGQDILTQTLRGPEVSIASLNNFLKNSGFDNDFEDTFLNWMAALHLNNNSFDSRYGYINKDLKGIKIKPRQRLYLTKLPGSAAIHRSVKNWEPAWIEIDVDDLPDELSENLRLDADGVLGQNLLISYIVFKNGFPTKVKRMNLINNSGSDIIPNFDGEIDKIVILATNGKKLFGFTDKESSHNFSIGISTISKVAVADLTTEILEVKPLILKDGDLIKRTNEDEIYVIWGKYKRFLRPEIIDLYGHLNSRDAIEVPLDIFHSYQTSNYVKYVDGEEVYAVWPNGTKHWFNITPSQWDASNRDWGAIFVINSLELDTYELGVDITK